MSQTSELHLIQRVAGGDEEALLLLHARYANLVFSVAYRVLEERMAAEEVTQDTFLRLWDKADTYDPAKGQFTTWLLTLARRRAIDMLRQRQRREPYLGTFSIDAHPGLWEHIPEQDETRDLRRTLRSALEALPQEQRDVLELAYFYGMTNSDIAAYLHAPLGTVKTRIRLGMQKLRQVWLESGSIHLEDRT